MAGAVFSLASGRSPRTDEADVVTGTAQTRPMQMRAAPGDGELGGPEPHEAGLVEGGRPDQREPAVGTALDPHPQRPAGAVAGEVRQPQRAFDAALDEAVALGGGDVVLDGQGVP